MKYTVANYIVDRLAALGLEHVFAVPGNYTADFLRAVESSKKIQYVGTTNELEAGYAADAYSRVRGIGAVCVTYGVGPGCLLNAIEGAFVEYCPVVLINGSPKAEKVDQFVKQGVLFAHAIDTFRTDLAIFTPITVAATVISESSDAPTEIDRVLRTCITEKRPVYLEVRDGVWNMECAYPDDKTIPLKPCEKNEQEIKDSHDALEVAIADVLEKLQSAEFPLIWGGEGLHRFGLQEEFKNCLSHSGLPYVTTLLGKGVIGENELDEQFIGVYDSVFAEEEVKKVVEQSDCILALGTILSDFYGKIVSESYGQMILVAGNAVRVGNYVYPHIDLQQFVCALSAALEKVGRITPSKPPTELAALKTKFSARYEAAPLQHSGNHKNSKITWDSFFAYLKTLITRDDYVLTDTSLCLFPSAEIPIEKRGHFICQTAWLSIGYCTGATVGIAAATNYKNRVIALIGDGGFQTLPQVISTLAMQNSKAVVFVFANKLYGLEQFLVDSSYFKETEAEPVFFNQLAGWDYAKLAEALGGAGVAISNQSDLLALPEKIDIAENKPILVSVNLDPTDLPREIRETLSGSTASRAVVLR